MFCAGCLPEVPADAPPTVALDWSATRLRNEVTSHVPEALAGASFLVLGGADKIPNKSVESNGRGGVCQSFHLVIELREVAERRRPPVPHLLRSAA